MTTNESFSQEPIKRYWVWCQCDTHAQSLPRLPAPSHPIPPEADAGNSHPISSLEIHHNAHELSGGNGHNEISMGGLPNHRALDTH